MNVLKSNSWSYVQNMIENTILTSYSDKSYFVASRGGYVASIQMMSRDKLKHQVSQQILQRDKLKHQVSQQILQRDNFLSCDITFMSSREVPLYHDCRKHKCCNRRIFSLTACELLRHVASCCATFLRYIINTYPMNNYVLLHLEHKRTSQ